MDPGAGGHLDVGHLVNTEEEDVCERYMSMVP